VSERAKSLANGKCQVDTVRYEDAYQYQRIFAPLVKLEAAYDRRTKEAQVQQNVVVRWDVGLNKKRLAFFALPKLNEELKLMAGDELRLTFFADAREPPWACVGSVVKLPDCECWALLNLHRTHPPQAAATRWASSCAATPACPPTPRAASRSTLSGRPSRSTGVSPGEYVHIRGLKHANTQDGDGAAPLRRGRRQRLQLHLPQAARPRAGRRAVQGGAAQALLGAQPARAQPQPGVRREDGAAAAAEPHPGRTLAKSATPQPSNHAQGPPGTGKTVTSATLVYQLVQALGGPCLVCAPSNIAVDQLTEKLHRTGLRVVRLCAKSREAIDSSVSFLALHNQVRGMEG